MARDKKPRRTMALVDPGVTEEPLEVVTPEAAYCEDQPKHETSMAPELLDVSSEIAQEIWETLKEEFYEQIEQLPLSLHRSFALIGEQDMEVQACQTELLPTIRSYIKLRQHIQADLHRITAGIKSSSPTGSPSVPSGPDRGVQAATGDLFGKVTKPQPTRLTPSNAGGPKHEEEDLDVMGYVILPHRGAALDPDTSNGRPAAAKSTSGDASSSHSLGDSHSAAVHTQGLRETDATVPKSAPFPPRPKPRTTRELLTRISFLTGELLRASEEKVGLASAAYDSVDRHVRALDAAIKEHEAAAALGLREGTRPVETAIHEGGVAGVNEEEVDDDEEPQLGMVGPTAGIEGRGAAPRFKRSKKGDRRDQRKHIVDGQLPTRVHALPTTAHQVMPIDPHEPRYCYCNQVSYGEMIACDNPDCKGEWFHLGCAGLAAPPKGKVKWYCRDCEETLGRNRRRRVH